MSDNEKYYVVKNQKIKLDKDLNCERILDIGGGGEGIIGLCYGNKVVAIDPREDELYETPDGPLKIVMDAGELSFLDNSFDAVTSFFTLMYINKEDHQKIFNEVYRVLKEDGEFILWDTEIPEYNNEPEDIFIINLEVTIPSKTITTGYGVSRQYKHQDMCYFSKLGLSSGFKVVASEKNDKTFKLVFKK